MQKILKYHKFPVPLRVYSKISKSYNTYEMPNLKILPSGAVAACEAAGSTGGMALFVCVQVFYCFVLLCNDCTELHWTELNCTILHCPALHCFAMYCTAVHYIAIQIHGSKFQEEEKKKKKINHLKFLTEPKYYIQCMTMTYLRRIIYIYIYIFYSVTLTYLCFWLIWPNIYLLEYLVYWLY